MGRKRLAVSADDAMSEASLLDAVRQLARLYGWRLSHPWFSIRSEPGYPDLTLVRGTRLLFIELKRADGELSDAQAAWIADLERTCAEVYVWRPEVLGNGQAIRVLGHEGVRDGT
jgi:hypothetical protein